LWRGRLSGPPEDLKVRFENWFLRLRIVEFGRWCIPFSASAKNEVNAEKGLIRRVPYFLVSFPDLFWVRLLFGSQTSLGGLFKK